MNYISVKLLCDRKKGHWLAGVGGIWEGFITLKSGTKKRLSVCGVEDVPDRLMQRPEVRGGLSLFQEPKAAAKTGTE